MRSRGRKARIDLTDGDQSTSTLVLLATDDGLSGLANREALMRRLEQVSRVRSETGAPVALLYCDVDHFKVVNDTIGHALGEDVLHCVARRLAEASTESDTVAWLGGDAFVVVVTGEVATRAEQLAAGLVDAMREPVRLTNRILPLSMSVGLAYARDDHAHPADLLRDADLALDEAKANGRDRVQVFSSAHAERLRQRARIERDLRSALVSGELTLRYQPIIDLVSGEAIGAEALVRWQHPELGLLEPAAFIDVAEDTGLVADIDRFTLEAACFQMREWACELHAPHMVSVNMSGRDLRDPNIVERVRTTIGQSGIDPARLCIEITESTMLFAGDGPVTALSALRELGCYLALDDFGTGYSSLAAVRRLPIEVVKIDRSFVDGLGADAHDAAVVDAVMSLAQALGLHVIAEGVETPAQARVLLELGCRAAQGFLFAKPLHPDAIVEIWQTPPALRRELFADPPHLPGRRTEPLGETSLLGPRDAPWRIDVCGDPVVHMHDTVVESARIQ